VEAAGGLGAGRRAVFRRSARVWVFYLHLSGALRAALLIVPIGIMAWLVPQVHALAAIGFCLCLGAGVAMPTMASAGIRRALDVRQYREGGYLHRIFGGAILRILFLLIVGTLGAASVLLTLAIGGVLAWLAATVALAGPPLILPLMLRIARSRSSMVRNWLPS
jgi:hypothetical protein